MADTTSPPKQTIAPVRIAHFVLVTADMAALVAWYTTVFGCEVMHQNERITFLTFDAEHHRIAIAQSPSLTPRRNDAAGVHHIAFTYDGLDSLLATYERLADAGIEPYWCVNHGMSTSMYYRDPDGNQIELQIDNFATEQELKAVFASEAFAKNVRGEDFDPRDMLARRRAGETVEDLVTLGSSAGPAS